MQPSNLLGLRFGRLVAVSINRIREKNRVSWNCVCDCGKIKVVSERNLTLKDVDSCGCTNKKKANLEPAKNLAKVPWRATLIEPGTRYGRLVVFDFDHTKVRKSTTYWKCKCDCGKVTSVRTDNLLGRKTKSCGCTKTNSVNVRTSSAAMVGKPYGRLIVLEFLGAANFTSWLKVKCKCGKVKIVSKQNIRSGATKSCGANKCKAKTRTMN